jgi:hypothetical protein
MSGYDSDNSFLGDTSSTENHTNDSELTQIYSFNDSAIGQSILEDGMYLLFLKL